MPIAYHGRSSSIILSGVDIKRPNGQYKAIDGSICFGPSKKIDYELEVGFVIGLGNELGSSINIEDARDHIFGLILLNDWSARDIQAWEYVPLGPFLGKNFATSISPWIITLEALELFETSPSIQDPLPLRHLENKNGGLYDINLSVKLHTLEGESITLCKGNLKTLYWSLYQMIAHHTSNGCNLRPGDILATGTISGDQKDSLGSLLELTKNGTEPLIFGKNTRTFIEDGDSIIITGIAHNGTMTIGFGECCTKVLSAQSSFTKNTL